jgi:hypothetical protein
MRPKKHRPRQRLIWQDYATLLQTALAIGGAVVDYSPVVYICLVLTLVCGMLAAWAHTEWPPWVRGCLAGGLLIIIPWLIVVRSMKDTERELAAREGILYPDHFYPSAEMTHCPPPPIGQFAFYLAGGLVTSGSFPFTAVQVGKTALLGFDRKGRGLLLRFKVFDDRGDIIASCENNKYWVRQDARMDRSEPSRLIVYDRKDERVLDLFFMNETAVTATGIFRDPNSPSRAIIATNRALIQMPNMIVVSAPCSYAAGRQAFHFE